MEEQETTRDGAGFILEHMVDGYSLHEVIQDESGNVVDYRFLDINPAFQKMTGLTRDIIGKTVLEILPGTEQYWIERSGQVALTGEPQSFEQYSAEIGKYFKVNLYCPEPMRFVSIFIDVTDKMVALKEKEQAEAQLHALLDNSRDIYIALDRNYCLLTANSTSYEYLEKLLGVKIEIGACLPELVKGDLAAEWRNRYDRALAGEDLVFHDTWGSGSGRYDTEVSIRPLVMNDETIGVTVISHDVTERNMTQERIQSLLEDKEILLKEVHHRIKNNIHIVRSMLELQAKSAGNDKASLILLDAQMRLGSMMTLYDKLYKDSDFCHISAKDFFSSLLKDIVEGLHFPVHSDLDVSDVKLDVKKASTLGIIVNELAANSVKYAFGTERDNKLGLALCISDGDVLMKYSDNGPGFNPKETRTGFGTELMKSYAASLGGTFKIDGSAGCVCELRVPFES